MRVSEFRQFVVQQLSLPRPRGTDVRLAAAVGVERIQIHHWRTGVRPIPDDRLEALAAALGFQVEVRVLGADGVPFTAPLPETGSDRPGQSTSSEP